MAAKTGSISRVLYASNGYVATIYLGRQLLVASSSLPESQAARTEPSPLFGLAPGGVCLAGQVTLAAGALLPHRFTLTPVSRGGLLSAALSLVSRPVGVTDHPVLRSPDFPPVSKS